MGAFYVLGMRANSIGSPLCCCSLLAREEGKFDS
jgi:hypothetical protein